MSLLLHKLSWFYLTIITNARRNNNQTRTQGIYETGGLSNRLTPQILFSNLAWSHRIKFVTNRKFSNKIKGQNEWKPFEKNPISKQVALRCFARHRAWKSQKHSALMFWAQVQCRYMQMRYHIQMRYHLCSCKWDITYVRQATIEVNWHYLNLCCQRDLIALENSWNRYIDVVSCKWNAKRFSEVQIQTAYRKFISFLSVIRQSKKIALVL